MSDRRRGLHTDREKMGLLCRDDATGAQSRARGYKGAVTRKSFGGV